MSRVENHVESGKDPASKNSSIYAFVFRIAPFVSLFLLVFIWFAAAGDNNRIFPNPLIVLRKMIDMLFNPVAKATLLQHAGMSMLRVICGLGFAILIGIPLGVMIGWNGSVRATIGALFECIRPIPVLAWIPLIIMWFGIGEKAKVIMIFIGALTPIVVNSYTGIKFVPALYLDVGKMFNASTEKQLLMKIVLPAALPSIFAGIRNATSVAWMVVLASEMLAAKSGLGFLVYRGMEVFDISLVMAGMVSIGLAGAFLSFLTSFIERKVCPWNTGIKSE